MSSAAAIDTDLLKEAADWAVTLHYDTPTDAERQAFDRWRRQSPAHEAAWARAQAVFRTFNQMPANIGKDALKRLEHRHDRRRALRLLGLVLLAAPAGWLAWRHTPWQEWTADLRAGTGEQKTVTLVDGTRLVLNTATAVDVAFTATERRLALVAGEIFITTAQDPSPARRPFIVRTVQGSLRPLGTRFNVRRLNDSTRVAVFEGAVEVCPVTSTQATIVQAGEQMAFTAGALQAVQPADDNAVLWKRGMLLAKDMRLGDVIAELARYRPGVLRCDPAVADMLTSGALSLTDTDAALALLSSTLPLRIEYRTRYWVTVVPRL
ncbi:FecR domain-containing protein [Bordetella sp. BOR01]|uniref:FecR domain-containing protein n=1 Tax=Bordetella sp. BOR01 TaxID=2854779 RepID=UPI001C47704A|nr:FecR domain-containing protein [Bordetella sp. BOR01]MBV7482992.1 FecR domain-containing protein [Bordetella sp. BOR01]